MDEVLLSPDYSAVAQGGPEWATALVRSGQGGAVAQRNINREDFVSRFEIDYLELSPERRRELRNFAILRQGMARGFRFLPPDDNFINDVVGYLTGSGDIIPIYSTNGNLSRFFLIRHYADPGNAYTRWITKPSPLSDWTVSIALAGDPGNILASATFTGGYLYNPFPVLPVARGAVLDGFGIVTLYYNLGILNFQTPPPAGHRITVSGTFHTAVAFTDDWQKFQVDEAGISEFKIQLEEILPIELGITPDMELPPGDFIPIDTPQNYTLSPSGAGALSAEWEASPTADFYILELSL